MRRLASVLAAASFAALVAVATSVIGAGPGPSPPNRLSPARPPVPPTCVVGDSLTVGAEPWLPSPIVVDAAEGRSVGGGLAVLHRRAARQSLPGTVLVALGTNDLAATASQVEEWARLAREIVGDRRLVWVNLWCDPSRDPDLARYRRVNDALAAAAERHGIELADWERWADHRDVQHTPDGVHHDEDSYRQRARFYVEALTRPQR